MEIYDCVQGEKEWFALRLGSIGGSSISSVVAGGKGKMRRSLLCQFAGEILSGQNYEGFFNKHMQRGLLEEPCARDMYEFVTDTDVVQVGVIKEGKHSHYSPDGLVGEDGLIEIKCVIPSVHIETVTTGNIPGNYEKQIQWGLHICQRKYCDFVSYSPLVTDLPIWIKRVERNEKLIGELREGADQFILDLAVTIRKLKEMR